MRSEMTVNNVLGAGLASCVSPIPIEKRNGDVSEWGSFLQSKNLPTSLLLSMY